MKNADEPINSVPYYERVQGHRVTKNTKGLTKREYFAGLAMQGLLSHFGLRHESENLAHYSKIYADQLLKALE